MGTYERHRKELEIKHDDVITQLIAVKLWVKYSVIISGVALGIALGALVM
jgi:hypothetical protein